MQKSGYIFIWKPKDWTSFDVIRKLKGHVKEMMKSSGIEEKYYKKLKIGHTGVLDPMAEGILLVGFGEATKFFQYIPDKKEYTASGIFGKISNTYDADGEIEDIGNNPIISKEEAEDILKLNFSGKINQIPPKYSNIKIDGKIAREEMRKGNDIEMRAREKEIYNIELLDFSSDSFTIRVVCESGTYIRSIINDFGKMLNTGAYCNLLIRTGIGEFKQDNVKVCNYIESNKEFDIEKNIISMEDMFSKSFFNPLELEEFFGDEFISKGKVKLNIGNTNSGNYPIFSKDKFLGFGHFNSYNNLLKSLRLISR